MTLFFMTAHRGRVGALTSVGAALALTVGATLAPAGGAAAADAAGSYGHPQKPKYAAVGDSYAAGVGTGAPTDGCYHSPLGFPEIVAETLDAKFTYAACSGATTADVPAQLAGVNPSTRLVTVTVGGNDIGFATLVGACAFGTDEQCRFAIGASSVAIATVLPQRLDTVYDAIEDAAPKARVVVTGYPLIFGSSWCPSQVNVSPTEGALLNALTTQLNQVIRAEALAHGFLFADVTEAFLGHAVCDSKPWVNGYVPTRQWDSFHPDVDGNEAYASVVLGALGE